MSRLIISFHHDYLSRAQLPTGTPRHSPHSSTGIQSPPIQGQRRHRRRIQSSVWRWIFHPMVGKRREGGGRIQLEPTQCPIHCPESLPRQLQETGNELHAPLNKQFCVGQQHTWECQGDGSAGLKVDSPLPGYEKVAPIEVET